MKITVTKDIPEDRIKGLLCCGMEGGIDYWAEFVRYEYGSGFCKEDFKEGGKMTDPNDYWHPDQIIPLAEGCSVVFREANDVQDDSAEEWKLNLDSIIKGLQIMTDKYPEHAANFLEENEDAETGDVFIQCCLFGEIVYG